MHFSVRSLAWLMGGCWVGAGWAAPPSVPPDYRFRAEVLAEGMTQPMELELAPDGRIFFNELGGRLRIWKPVSREIVEAGRLEVFNEQENGFLGFALDPRFRANGWIYLLYSPKDYVGQRLSRFIMRGDHLEAGSERKLLEFGEQRRECCHHAGSVEFGPDGLLYVSTGDNTHPGGDSDGYAPIDERPDRDPYDAQKSAANTHDLRGKVLRIRPTKEGGYTIPDGNLFPRDGTRGRPEIYAMGCRNPWRMSVDQRTGIVYWGEVGPDAGGDGRRGPRGYDEINQARHAGNFGWPLFVGSNFAYVKYDFATKSLGGRFDVQAPTNTSPNNTGARVLPPAQPAFLYWPYGNSKEFPSLGSGGRTACAGPVFYFRSSFRKTGGFPEYFDRCLLFYDWQRPFMKWARLDADSRLLGIEAFTSTLTLANDKGRILAAEAAGEFVIRRPIDSQFGADGCLYLLDYGETWGVNKDSKLVKVSYEWGNIAPVAKAAASPLAGPVPLTVELDGLGSKDHEGDRLTYEWRLHGGAAAVGGVGGAAGTAPAQAGKLPAGVLLARTARTRVTLEQAGNYVLELRVRDGRGGAASANLPLIAGNSPPEVQFVEPHDGDFFTPGKPVRYQVAARDAEDGSSTDYEESFDPRTFVSARWGQTDGKENSDEPGLALMKQSDCFNCHAVEQKIVGPPLLEVATRYRGQSGALAASVERVVKGSSGVWSEIPMLPHGSLTTDQVQTMVRWIFALEPGKSDASTLRGLSGSLKAPQDDKIRVAIFEATYTDAGQATAGSLSGRATVKLRHRRLQAELGDELRGAKVTGGFVGSIDHGHYIRFARVNLSDSVGATCRVASAGAGGKIEIRAGSATGDLLGVADVPPTGGWEKWVEVTTSLKPAGRGDIFVVFVNPGQAGLMNLDWIRFEPAP